MLTYYQTPQERAMFMSAVLLSQQYNITMNGKQFAYRLEARDQKHILHVIVKSSTLSSALGNLNSDVICCLKFRLNEETDLTLKENLCPTTSDTTTAWSQNENVCSHILEVVRQFIDFTATNIKTKKMCFIANESYFNENEQRAKIILYQNGRKKENFRITTKMNAPRCMSMFPGDDETVDDEKENPWTVTSTGDIASKHLIVKDLKAEKNYVFKLQAMTVVGFSPPV
ncbi:unnamed protein product [Rotaria sp. Silwood1]|nr:unnamed protein product [Rotaria sp. Silwood1]CAF1639604.1 unnamed protein product [Rotaria sp. Silwood1]